MGALIAPNGARVTVSDEKAARLLDQGFRTVGDVAVSDGRPKGNASRDEWASFADSLGVQYAEDAKREDIKAAVDAAGH